MIRLFLFNFVFHLDVTLAKNYKGLELASGGGEHCRQVKAKPSFVSVGGGGMETLTRYQFQITVWTLARKLCTIT